MAFYFIRGENPRSAHYDEWSEPRHTLDNDPYRYSSYQSQFHHDPNRDDFGPQPSSEPYRAPIEPTHPDHSSVQVNAALHMNEVRRGLPILALIYLIWNVIEIATIATVLGVTWDKPCDEPTIRIICIARIVRNCVMVPIHFRRVLRINEDELDLRIQGFNRISLLFFFIFSQQWLTDGDVCRKQNPILYWTGIGVIVLLYLTILAPFIIIMLACLCLPCVLAVFNCLNIGTVIPTAATDEDMEQLNTFQYDPDTFREPDYEHPTTTDADRETKTAPGVAQRPTATATTTAAGSPRPVSQPQYSPHLSPRGGVPTTSTERPKTPQYPTQPELPSAPQLTPQSRTTAGAPKPPKPPASGNVQECPVCLCEFEKGEQLKQLKCQHLFHSECIVNWLKLNRTCPCCRADAITGVPADINQSRGALQQFF